MAVTVHTTVGDFKMELFCEQCPKVGAWNVLAPPTGMDPLKTDEILVKTGIQLD